MRHLPPVCQISRRLQKYSEAFTEHAVIKRLRGFGKVRYRGLPKNATRAFTALAPANIYLSRQRLMT